MHIAIRASHFHLPAFSCSLELASLQSTFSPWNTERCLCIVKGYRFKILTHYCPRTFSLVWKNLPRFFSLFHAAFNLFIYLGLGSVKGIQKNCSKNLMVHFFYQQIRLVTVLSYKSTYALPIYYIDSISPVIIYFLLCALENTSSPIFQTTDTLTPVNCYIKKIVGSWCCFFLSSSLLLHSNPYSCESVRMRQGKIVGYFLFLFQVTIQFNVRLWVCANHTVVFISLLTQCTYIQYSILPNFLL